MTDLYISDLMYDPNSAVAEFFTFIGETPAIAAALFALLSPLVLLKRFRIPDTKRELILRFALQTALSLTLSVAAVYAIKHFWGRIRYTDLKSAADFTPWYSPGAAGTGDSFPSGHAAMAAFSFLPFVYLKYTGSRLRYLAFALAAAFTAAVAFSRIVLGAHYLSDVTAGIAITAISLILSGVVVPKRLKAPENTPRGGDIVTDNSR